jgi:hypothetical protein
MLLQFIIPRLSLAKIFIFSLIVSASLLFYSSAFKFYKTVNLFQISTRLCYLPSTSFNFLEWISPYKICVFVYRLPISPSVLPPPDNDQYHNLPSCMNGHQVYLNAVSCLSKCGQFNIESFPQKMSKQTYECYDVGTLYFWQSDF